MGSTVRLHPQALSRWRVHQLGSGLEAVLVWIEAYSRATPRHARWRACIQVRAGRGCTWGPTISVLPHWTHSSPRASPRTSHAHHPLHHLHFLSCFVLPYKPPSSFSFFHVHASRCCVCVGLLGRWLGVPFSIHRHVAPHFPIPGWCISGASRTHKHRVLPARK